MGRLSRPIPIVGAAAVSAHGFEWRGLSGIVQSAPVEPAPSTEPMPRNAAGTDLERDQFGNAVGGIRTPYVDAPVATFTGGGQTGSSFCGAFGTTTLFDEAALSVLYPTREVYVAAIDTATDSAVEKGFLLSEDGELIKAQARLSDKFAD